MTNISLNVDKSKLEETARRLKDNPGLIGDLSKDPKGFLARFGVEVDDATAQAIRDRLASAPKDATPAGIVHIDL